jgi:hypothetical protein
MVNVRSSENQAASVLLPDRDVNATRGLLYLADSGAESINARGGAVRPGTVRRVLVKREPGTGKLGQTGTVVWQRTAAT